MNRIIASTLGSVLALTLAATSLAASPAKELRARDIHGVVVLAPVASFSTRGFSSTNETKTETVTEYIRQWSLGPIGFDINGANLKIVGINAPASVHVLLKDASSGGASDRLVFLITADANTPKGSYPVKITLENSKFGYSGVVTVMVNVQ